MIQGGMIDTYIDEIFWKVVIVWNIMIIHSRDQIFFKICCIFLGDGITIVSPFWDTPGKNGLITLSRRLGLAFLILAKLSALFAEELSLGLMERMDRSCLYSDGFGIWKFFLYQYLQLHPIVTCHAVWQHGLTTERGEEGCQNAQEHHLPVK